MNKLRSTLSRLLAPLIIILSLQMAYGMMFISPDLPWQDKETSNLSIFIADKLGQLSHYVDSDNNEYFCAWVGHLKSDGQEAIDLEARLEKEGLNLQERNQEILGELAKIPTDENLLRLESTCASGNKNLTTEIKTENIKQMCKKYFFGTDTYSLCTEWSRE